MRVLFTCAAEHGHFNPHLPLARALRDAGHAVGFAMPESFRARVGHAGFAALPVGMDRAETATEIARRFPEWSTVRGRDLLRFALVNIGARITAPATLPHLVAATREWGADLLVHGPGMFAGPIAASLAGIPSVNQSWGPLLPLGELRPATDAVAELWRQNGLEAPPLGGLLDRPYLDVCPPLLQSADIEELPIRQLMRPLAAVPVGTEGLPDRMAAMPHPQTIYVTLGTFFNHLTKHFLAILDALADEPVNVVVTVGYDQDPAVLGPQPDHVMVERYIPLSLLLPHCDAMVTHGGSGSVLAALSYGVPMLVVPLGADQFHNAERCVASGAGRSLASENMRPEAIRGEVAQLLERPDCRRAARRVEEEIASMPAPDEIVPMLERLVFGGAE